MKFNLFSNIVLNLFGILSTLIFLYFVFNYDNYFLRPSFSPDIRFVFAFFYYLIPALVATLSFISLRIKSPAKMKISLIFLSSALGLYMAEILSSKFSVTTSNAIKTHIKQAEERNGAKFDRREALDVVQSLRENKIEAFLAITPHDQLKFQDQIKFRSRSTSHINFDELLSILPLGGISNKVTVKCNETGKYLIYTSDKYGFHNPKDIWDAEGLQIAAIGDSFTFGNCVSSEKNMIAHIRRRYPLTLNLGMGGNGPLLELATLLEYLPTRKPRVVLWFFFENDLINLKHKERNNPTLMRYLNEGYLQDLTSKQDKIDKVLTTYHKLMANLILSKIKAKSRWTNKFINFITLGNLRKLIIYNSELGKPGKTNHRYKLFKKRGCPR